MFVHHLYFNRVLLIKFLLRLPSTPPTSPQRAQSAARQAERNQRNLGSPPARRLPQNVPAPAVHIVCVF